LKRPSYGVADVLDGGDDPKGLVQMGEIGPFLVPMTLFVSVAAVFIFRGPLGKAIGDRIAGHSADGAAATDTEALHGEIDELRYRLAEVEERLDFAERLLAQTRSDSALPPHGE
jgi:hypothetical protein